MAIYFKCTYCNVFLTSSGANHREKHITTCTQRDDPVKTKCIENQFHRVSFPNATILLDRISITTTAFEIGKEKERRKSQRKRKVRKLENYDYDDLEDTGEYSDSDYDDCEDTTNPDNLVAKVNKIRNKDRWKHDPYFVNKHKFSCDKCSAQFYSVAERNSHAPIHTNPIRKPIECLVCQRAFNKRDSLNSHIAAHETAEAKEENLNLLKNWPKNPYDPKSPFSRTRYACRFCLLMCTNHASFLNHLQSEHGGTTLKLPCRLGKCSQKFDSVRELVRHARMSHPVSFYGKLTWNKMNNRIFNKNRKSQNEDEKYCASTINKKRKHKTISPSSRKCNGKRKKRINNNHSCSDFIDEILEERFESVCSANAEERLMKLEPLEDEISSEPDLVPSSAACTVLTEPPIKLDVFAPELKPPDVVLKSVGESSSMIMRNETLT